MMLELILKTIFIYFLILASLRFMGKREIGQLGLFDFVVLLLIADVSAIILDEGKSIILCLVPVALLSIIQKLLAIISLKIPFIRNIVDGKESIIIYEGKLNIKEMKKQNYNIDDLLSQLRLKNVRSLSQVEYLILETSGEISVFLYKDFKKTNIPCKSKTGSVGQNGTSSFSLETFERDISLFPIVISGKINEENLKMQKIEKKWLLNEITKQGFTLDKVYYANIEHNKLFIMKTINSLKNL